MTSPSRTESPTLGRAITLDSSADNSDNDEASSIDDLKKRLQTREALIRQRMRLRNRRQSPTAVIAPALGSPPSPSRSTSIRTSCYSMSSLRSPVTDTFQLEALQPINYSRPLSHQRSASSLRSPTITDVMQSDGEPGFNRRLSAYFADPYRGSSSTASSPRAASPSCFSSIHGSSAGRRRSLAAPPPTPPPTDPLPTPPAAVSSTRRRKTSHDSSASGGSSRSSTSLEKIQEEDRGGADEDGLVGELVSPIDHVDDKVASGLGLFGTWRRKKTAPPPALRRAQSSLASVELIKAIQDPLSSTDDEGDDEDVTYRFGSHARNASNASELTLGPNHESLLDFPIPPSRRPSDDSTHRMSILTLSSGTSAASSNVHLTPTQGTMRDSIVMQQEEEDENDELMREDMSSMMSGVKQLGSGPSPEGKKRFARRPGPDADYWGEPEIITDRV